MTNQPKCPFGHGSASAEERPSVMERLKTGTQDLHDSAENHRHQVSLVKGELPLSGYVEHLKQHYVLHKGLEAKMREVFDSHPAFEAVVKDEQFQEPYLVEDLNFFGVDPAAVEAAPETAELVSEIEAAIEAAPIKAMGYHYVLEGSNNGNRFISKKLAKVYELEDGKGLKYLDPYGEEQRPKWMAFRGTMDTIEFTQEESDAMLEAARHMFGGIAKVSEGIANAAQPA